MQWARPVLITVGVITICLIVSDGVLAQCAMCKTGLLNSPEGQKLASGFNTGILFLLSVPFLVVGTLALLILNAQRRKEQKHRRHGEWATRARPAASPPPRFVGWKLIAPLRRLRTARWPQFGLFFLQSINGRSQPLLHHFFQALLISLLFEQVCCFPLLI